MTELTGPKLLQTPSQAWIYLEVFNNSPSLQLIWMLDVTPNIPDLESSSAGGFQQIHQSPGAVITFRLNLQQNFVLLVVPKWRHNIFLLLLQKRIKRDCSFHCSFPSSNRLRVVLVLPKSSCSCVTQIREAPFFSSYLNSIKWVHYVPLWTSWKWGRH